MYLLKKSPLMVSFLSLPVVWGKEVVCSIKKKNGVHHSAPLPPPLLLSHTHPYQPQRHRVPQTRMACHSIMSEMCHVISFFLINIIYYYFLLFLKGFRACVVHRKQIGHCDVTHPHHALLFSDSACASSCHKNEFQIQRSKWLIDVRGEIIYRV